MVLFGRKSTSVDSVVEKFGTMVDELIEVDNHHEETAIEAAEEIEALSQKYTASKDEARRAAKVRDNLRNLIGG